MTRANKVEVGHP